MKRKKPEYYLSVVAFYGKSHIILSRIKVTALEADTEKRKWSKKYGGDPEWLGKGESA